jgi:hypothetical protein
MDAMAKSRIQMFGVWCAAGYLAVLFVGWGAVAGFLPPTPPSAGADKIAALFDGDFTRIRIGMLLVMLAALVFIPFAAVVSQFIAQIEGTPGILTYTFLLGAAGNMVLTFYPAVWWLTAAFRPDRAPELIYLMNDMAWLQFLGGVTMYLAMPLSVAVASLCDKSAEPAFPRWCGYANLWMALTILPDQLSSCSSSIEARSPGTACSAYGSRSSSSAPSSSSTSSYCARLCCATEPGFSTPPACKPLSLRYSR